MRLNRQHLAAIALAVLALPCVAQTASSAPGGGWHASIMDEALVRKATLQYLDAMDTGHFAQAYGMFSTDLKSVTPFDQWQATSRAFNERAGAVATRRIVKISFYRDPPDARPGTYAASDLASTFANIDLACGYVAWKRDTDGSWRVIHVLDNVVDKASFARMDPALQARVRAKFTCMDR